MTGLANIAYNDTKSHPALLGGNFSFSDKIGVFVHNTTNDT